MGIVKSARNVFKARDLNQLIATDQLIDENAVVIMMDESPRKWYWNILMIVLPLLFLVATLRAAVNAFRGVPLGIPKNKL